MLDNSNQCNLLEMLMFVCLLTNFKLDLSKQWPPWLMSIDDSSGYHCIWFDTYILTLSLVCLTRLAKMSYFYQHYLGCEVKSVNFETRILELIFGLLCLWWVHDSFRNLGLIYLSLNRSISLRTAYHSVAKILRINLKDVFTV